MEDYDGEPAKKPAECAGIRCPNIRCANEDEAGERWSCAICGAIYEVDYEA